jgi:hypothetical protein
MNSSNLESADDENCTQKQHFFFFHIPPKFDPADPPKYAVPEIAF